MTYWLLNAVFLGIVAVVVAVAVFRRLPVRWAAVAGAMVVVLAMTAVFDNVMIAVGLVGYDPTRISNVFVGIAPVEDFAYAIAAVLLLPALWSLLPPRRRSDRRPVDAATRAGKERP
ncbi:lycopene cyclase domain-containing protein [Desertivibrio insolitus]|uniref:lycopene cyclase domain-containing protein n=1 Tax=Herbiconiux sp. SYSU D00978 TaxID=2812562 RepID=UPI001A9787C5|nr:lycopene cyclase domain-containing protein [Herbiconiux sp. SYSU D00978]